MSESETLLKETLMPVYVVPEDEQLLFMYEEVKQVAALRTSSIIIRGKRVKKEDVGILYRADALLLF